MKKIAIIGGGNMGAAIFSRVRGEFSVCVCEASAERQSFLKRNFKIKTEDIKSAVKKSDVIILAVKPQDFDPVLNEIRPFISSKKLVISIAAGVTSIYIEEQLGEGARVIRTMPNMPAQISEGITAIAGGKLAKPADIKLAQTIFNCVGKTITVEENLIDAITAVSGSGPAYVFLFVECLMKAAQALGLNEAQSRELVYSTLAGSAHLLERSRDDAATLRSKVTSKGGTTQAAMDVFTQYNIEKIFQEALSAAQKRAKELSK
ncbi:MAG: pyrroline-5-carboxylate reductase [Omnitrophica WOR_2 bacterium GWA2_47_8]|nr:MAG: pyrroline-5-carboxylate reductase [Omnitrophica WOR_2 bacterium GWA2_47_8]